MTALSGCRVHHIGAEGDLVAISGVRLWGQPATANQGHTPFRSLASLFIPQRYATDRAPRPARARDLGRPPQTRRDATGR